MSDCCSTVTFTLESTTTKVFLSVPEWEGEGRQLTKTVDLFDFWSGGFDTVDKGKNTEPITLEGYEQVCGDNEGLCFPICFPACFSGPLASKFEDIWAIQNNNDEVTISGLGDCINGVYVIQSFTFDVVPKTKGVWFKWVLKLEFVRDS